MPDSAREDSSGPTRPGIRTSLPKKFQATRSLGLCRYQKWSGGRIPWRGRSSGPAVPLLARDIRGTRRSTSKPCAVVGGARRAAACARSPRAVLERVGGLFERGRARRRSVKVVKTTNAARRRLRGRPDGPSAGAWLLGLAAAATISGDGVSPAASAAASGSPPGSAAATAERRRRPRRGILLEAAQDHALDRRVEVAATIVEGAVGGSLGVLAPISSASVAPSNARRPVKSS